MLTLTTNRDNFKELKKNPLLFLVKKNKSTGGTWNSTTEIVWEPLDKKIEGTIPNTFHTLRLKVIFSASPDT